MKNLTSNKKKLSLIIIILALTLISLGIYMISNKSNDNNNNNNNNNNDNNEVENKNDKIPEEKVEELDINSEEVKKLYEIARMETKIESVTKSNPFNGYIESDIYTKKEMKVKDIDNKSFFTRSLVHFIQNERYNFEYIEYSKDDHYSKHIEIKKNELKKVLYTLFGDEYTIDDFELYRKRIVASVINYNKEKDTYSFVFDGIPVVYSTTETKLIKAEKDKDCIYLYEKVGVTTNLKTKYFSNMIDLNMKGMKEREFLENNKDKAKDLNGKSIWEYEDNLSTFRYVLKKDKNGEYHLYSMGYVEVK